MLYYRHYRPALIILYVTVQVKTNLVHTSNFAWLMTCIAFWNVTQISNFQQWCVYLQYVLMLHVVFFCKKQAEHTTVNRHKVVLEFS